MSYLKLASLYFAATLALFTANQGSAQRDTLFMQRNSIEAEFGTVISQLLAYRFTSIPPAGRTLGQTRAMASASAWIDAIVKDSLQPGEDAVVGFHSASTTSCDSVKIQYEPADSSEPLQLSIIQTVYSILVVVEPIARPTESDGDAGVTALKLAKRLFKDDERFKFRVLKQQAGFVIGEQVVKPEQLAQGTDWLDSIRWWLDGRSVGFAMLKNTGPGQAARTSWDLQPNLVWFQMYERSRTR